jgi:hypothetical protein
MRPTPFCDCKEQGHGTGITDIEVEVPGLVHVIVEAKRGWTLPAQGQLEQYIERLRRSHAVLKRVVVLSECSLEYAKRRLPLHEAHGILVEPPPGKKLRCWPESPARALATKRSGFSTSCSPILEAW